MSLERPTHPVSPPLDRPAPPLPAPALVRRLASLLYEGVVLFGVVMIAGYLYSSLTQQRHALEGHAGLQAFLFLVLDVYFVWFWSHGGQTVAMKAWRVRLVTADGGPVSQARALVRYLACWLWFLPALLASFLLGLRNGWHITLAMISGVAVYASLATLLPGRQFLHDQFCGTRLVDSTGPAHRP